MKEIHVKSQKELNAIADDYDGKIYIEFGTPSCPAVLNRGFIYPVEARDNSYVTAYGNSSVVAHDNSHVEAFDNSSVVAYGNSYVVAYDNSYVVAYGNNSVVANDNSHVEAFGNNSVEAFDNSSVAAFGNSYVVAFGNNSVEAFDNSSVAAFGNSYVVAYDNSHVEAYDNTQVSQCSDYCDINICRNARIVHNPTNISEYLEYYAFKEENDKIKLFKAVHKRGNRYLSDSNINFEYTIGKYATADSITEDVSEACGHGIHIAPTNWCLNYGRGWDDLAILEVEAETDKIIVPRYTDGKVRTLSVKVLREVPLEECGTLGKILAKRRKQREAAEISQ